MSEVSGATVYGVEGAVWGCFTGAWLALRLSLARSPVEEFALIPVAGLAVCALLATSASGKAGGALGVELALFHVAFGMWATLVYATAEGLLNTEFARGVLENQTFAVASLAVSLSFLTIQTLVAAAAVRSPSVWARTAWAKAVVVLVTTLHACTKHDSQQYLALSVIILWADFAAACLEPFQQWGLPLELGVGPLSAQQILDICSLSLQVVSSCFALGLAYASGRTQWALPPFLALPLAALVYDLVTGDNYRAMPSAPPEDLVRPAEQPARQQPQPQPQPPQKPGFVFPQIIPAPYQQPVRPAPFPAQQARPSVPPAQQARPSAPPAQQARPPPVNPDLFKPPPANPQPPAQQHDRLVFPFAHHTFHADPGRVRHVAPQARVGASVDALLFRHAAPAAVGSKKNM